jgi:two-component sensor histidine kinase
MREVPSEYESMALKKDGGELPVHINIAEIQLGDGRATLAFITDETERKRNEERIQSLLEEKEIILKEVHHRIKNNMNTMKSLIGLQAFRVKDATAKAALVDTENRLVSMMLLYDELYRSTSFTDISIKKYLSSLMDNIVHNFPDSESVSIESGIDDFQLNAKKAQTIGIIINELVTNIMKYAFGERPDRTIAICARQAGSIVTISLQDNGEGMPDSIDFNNSPGFGLMLVKELTKQLGGTIRIERGAGTKIILEFEG